MTLHTLGAVPARVAAALAVSGLLAGGLLAACDGTPPPARPDEVTATDAGPVREVTPRFRGSMQVTLRVGRTVYSADVCAPGAETDRVCDPSTGRAYLLLGEGSPARLTDARMVLTGGGTSWTARFTLTDGTGTALRRTREEARATGASVLVLAPSPDGAGDDLLVSAGVPDVSAHRIAFHALEKSEAWDRVERVAQR